MLGPQYKVPFELITMQTLFPKANDPKPIDNRVAHVMDQMLPKEVGNWWKGRPFPKTWKSDLAESLVTYKQDINRMAYNSTLARKDEFLKKYGFRGRGYHTSEKSSIAYNMALAWRYGDSASFAKNFAEYIKLSYGKVRGIPEMLDAIDPLYGMTDNQKALFISQMDSHERNGLMLAYKYYVEIRSGVQFKKE